MFTATNTINSDMELGMMESNLQIWAIDSTCIAI